MDGIKASQMASSKMATNLDERELLRKDKTMNRNQLAVERFQEQRAKVKRQLDHIEKLMNGWDEGDDFLDQIHFGHVGDVAHVSSLLQRAINFMHNSDDDVEVD